MAELQPQPGVPEPRRSAPIGPDPGPLLLLRAQLQIVQSGFGTADDWRRILAQWCMRLLGSPPRPRLVVA